jgi:hypothetical protein
MEQIYSGGIWRAQQVASGTSRRIARLPGGSD